MFCMFIWIPNALLFVVKTIKNDIRNRSELKKIKLYKYQNPPKYYAEIANQMTIIHIHNSKTKQKHSTVEQKKKI